MKRRIKIKGWIAAVAAAAVLAAGCGQYGYAGGERGNRAGGDHHSSDEWGGEADSPRAVDH